MAVYKEEKTGTWRAVYRYTIGMVSGSRPKSAVLRLSERRRLGA